MPSHSGPNSSAESNLVFGYDLGNRSVSYKGEPTVNLIPNPAVNSRFSAGNGWGTYNTAQYNGNTYFSIGTIESVIDNVITLATVDREIYTFDVLRAQTSGGGINAGTDYLVKKISDNQFTLHAYNSSQDGSQGYINPDTRMHKVHDSIGFDDRIPVSFDEFPTVWWGSPHKPNMCYVKEIRSQGGPNNDSSFMRIHLTRTVRIDGGMAYGVRPPITQGDIVTLSFWAKASMVRNWSWSAWFGGGSYSGASGSISATTEWQRFEYTWTASNTIAPYLYFWPGSPGTLPYYVDIADLQVEVNRGHATTFTLSERTVTDSLLDLTGNNTIDLSNVSFDSNELITFDGTDDYVSIVPRTQYGIDESWTAELVFKPTLEGDNSWNGLFGGSLGQGGYWMFHSSGNLTYYEGYSGTVGTKITYRTWTKSNTFTTNDYHHLTIVYTTTSATTGNFDLYYNGGEKTDTFSWTFTWNYSLDMQTVGAGDGRYGTNDIHYFKFYNKALTNEEVQKNFNAVKSRFNIV